MTCLVPPALFLPDGQPDDSADRRRERYLAQVGATYQQLLDQWRGLGLELDLFLATPAALPRLSAWDASHLEQLQQILTELLNAPQSCRELQSALRGLGMVPDAGFSEETSPGLCRILVWLRPLLSLQGLTRLVQGRMLTWPPLAGDPLAMPLQELGLSIRVLNRLRGQRMACLADLAGLKAEQLLAIRGMGVTSIQEIVATLDQQGLALPFSIEDGWALPPLAMSAPAVVYVDRPQRAAVAAAATPTHRDSLAEESAEARDWPARAIALLSDPEADGCPERVLQALQALTVERFPSLRQRLEELHQVQELLRSVAISSCLNEAHASPLPDVWTEAVQQRVLSRYRELIAAGESTTTWLVTLKSHLFRYPQAMTLLLQHLSGCSLTALGEAMQHSVSRDRVRHQIQVLERLLGLQLASLRTSCQNHLARQEAERKAAILRNWITASGRLPFHTDGDEERPLGDAETSDLWQQVRQLKLNDRLGLHAELDLPVPEAEWDLHFRVLANNEERPGTGYWDTIEPLRQLLPRFAVLFSAPGLMPKQKQLPAAVHSAVQRHGGQSKVARMIGLAYQGQLVGEHGRTYWTDLRLEQLLEQTVNYCRLPLRAMPSRLQIRAFLLSGLVIEYADKSAETVFAALTRQSTLSWGQVAQRFGRT